MAEAAIHETETLVNTKSVALPRSMGIFATLVFSVAAISLMSTITQPFAVVTGLYPGSSLIGIVSVGAGVCLVYAFLYAIIGIAVKRNGADYILVSRVLHPLAGFATSWTVVAFSGLIIGSLLAQIGQITIPLFLRMIAIISNAQTMMSSADFFATPQGISVTGAVATVIAFVLAILPLRVNQRILQVGFGLLILSWLALLVQFLLPASLFQSAWNHFMGLGSYEMQVQMATGAGMKLATSTQPMLIGGLIFAFFIFYGFQAPTYMAGEIKKPERGLLIGNLGTVVISWALIAVTALLIQYRLPADWASAQSFLYLSGKTAQPWVNFYAAVMQPNPILITLISFTWLFSLINVAQVYFIFTSRILLAWTEDGLLPESLGFLHPQFRSPTLAILIAAILAQAGIIFISAGSVVIENNFMFIFFAVITQLFPVLAVLVMPFVKKDWFASRDPLVRMKLGPIPVVSLVALAILVYDGWLLSYSLLSSDFHGQAMDSLWVLLGVTGSGVIYYFLRRSYLNGSGKKLDTTFRNFPAD
jgi:basic amino acid/polyamine antiporter, APA family